MKYLGDHFDIHTGGIDLLPTHHNNEIAQSTCSTGKPFVNVWLHNEHVNFGNEKMSKSLGNVATLASLRDAGYDPLDYRYWLLQGSYRSKVSFGLEGLQAARTARLRLSEKAQAKPNSPNEGYLERFSAAIRNDLGTAEGLSIAWEAAKSDLSEGVRSATLRSMDEVLGLSLGEQSTAEIPDHILALAKERDTARSAEDWTRADQARDAIISAGFEVRDTSAGTEVVSRN